MTHQEKSSVGVIGLGIIGAQVARHLEEAGYPVVKWNRTPRDGQDQAASPADVARQARIIQLFVADPQAVYDVLEAMAEALTPEHLILCSATIGRDATLEAARRLEKTGARLLDAPFTGSKEAARAAQLLYYLGGEEADMERAHPILAVTGRKGIVRIGALGEAAVIKVATNILSAVTVEVLSEMVALVEAAGIRPEVLQRALEAHGVRSGIIDMKLPKMIAGDYETHFALRHMLKDVRFGLEMATELKLDLPASALTANLMETGVTNGWGDHDFATLHRLYA